MKAILNGRFLEDEFQTRIGVEKHELQKVIDDFPQIDDSEKDTVETLAINNCLNEVCNGLDLSEQEWEKCFSVGKSEIIKAYANWAKIRDWKQMSVI